MRVAATLCAATAVCCIHGASGFALRPPAATGTCTSLSASRRDFLSDAVALAGIAAATAAPAIAFADDEELAVPASDAPVVPRSTSRLGGLLEPYSDAQRAFRFSKPLGWNKFDGVPGEYEVKFTDIINPAEMLVLTTTAVKSDTQLSKLGTAAEVGERLAGSRSMTLVSSRDRRTDGLRFYDLELSGARLHEVRTLCIYKGRLWSLSATTTAKNWGKREEAYHSIQESFMPRL